jgi:hypothetical protein
MTSAFNWHPERRPAIDLLGQKFGLLTVIASAPSLGHSARWRCRCECGAETVLRAREIKRNGGRMTHRECGGKS